MRGIVELIDTGKDFPNRMPIAQSLRPTINIWDLMKLQSFYMAKNTIVQNKVASYIYHHMEKPLVPVMGYI